MAVLGKLLLRDGAERDTIAYIAHCRRAPTTLHVFLEAARGAGLDAQAWICIYIINNNSQYNYLPVTTKIDGILHSLEAT